MKAKSDGRVIREHEYGRYGNPTQQECERKLAAANAEADRRTREVQLCCVVQMRLERELAASEKEIARLRVLLGNLNREASKSHITYSLGDAIDATTAYVTGHD